MNWDTQDTSTTLDPKGAGWGSGALQGWDVERIKMGWGASESLGSGLRACKH